MASSTATSSKSRLETESSAPRLAGAPWFAAYTRSRHEKKVAEALSELGVECYLPLRRMTRRWSDRNKQVDTPLFPGYVFVRCSEEDRARTFNLAGMVRYVASDGRPVPIPDEEVAAIRRLLESRAPFDPLPNLEPGQRVEVISGPMKGVAGVLLRKGSSCRLVLGVKALGRGVAVEIDAEDVRGA